VHSEKERKQRLQQTKKKLIRSLFFNLLLPCFVYMVLRPHFTTDTAPLAISTIIPVIKTMVQWIWQHRVDWIGVISTFILSIALVISFISGGNSLPIKLVHPAVFGIIGLIFIISVLAKKPLLLIIFRAIGQQNKEHYNNPVVHKKITVMTALVGGVSFIGSIIHIVMAIVLPTGSFLVMSNMVSVGAIAILIVGAKFIVSKIK
jgi:hypothetical protein